jgi:hypothetical protein
VHATPCSRLTCWTWCFRRPFKSLFRRTEEASGGPLVKAREKLRVVAPLWPWTATWTKKQNHCRRQVYFLSFLDQGSPLCSFVFTIAYAKKPSDVIMTIKSSVRWTGHVTHMEAMKNIYTSLLRYLCVDRRIMSTYIYIYCGPMMRVSGCRSRGPGYDSRRYQIFWEAVGLERGPLNLLSTIEELRGRKSSGSGLKSREYGLPRGTLIRKSWH